LHLQTFLAVADARSYSAAAEQLHMSQPAVSQHIHALEEQLDGVRLFRRVGKQMVPTHAGEELLGTARELVSLASRAEATIRSLKGQLGGRVMLGCTPSSGERLLAPLLAAFRTRFPSVTLDVQVAPQPLLLAALGDGRIEIALVEEPQRRRGWESQLLGNEPLILLAPKGHALLQQDQPLPTTLRDYPLLLPRAGGALRRIIEDGLRRRGLPPTDLLVALESDSMTLLMQGVRAAMGLAFVPRSRLPGSRDVREVALADLALQQDWYALRARSRSGNQAVDELFAFFTGKDGRTVLAREGLLLPD
jgi:DNA-binding transcriptional LysR family regulator